MDTFQKENNISDYNCTSGLKVFRIPHITEAECQPIDDVTALVFSDLIYTLTFIAIAANILKVISTVRCTYSWTTTQMYLLNLAISHIIFLLACPVWGIYLSQQYDWHFGEHICSVMNSINAFGHCGSILFSCVICIDRMFTICFPALSLQYKNITFGKMVLMTVWALCTVMATLSYVYTAFNVYGVSKHFCGSMQVSNLLNFKSVRALILFGVPNILTPTLFLVPCYTKIMIYFLCQKTRLPFEMGRAVKLDITYLSSFIVLCLSMGYILMIICFVYVTLPVCHNECTWASIINISNETARLLSMCNAVISPLVYHPKCGLGPCSNCPHLKRHSRGYPQQSGVEVSSVQLVYIASITEDTTLH